MIEKFIFIFCYLLANTWSARGQNLTFIKNGNSYESTYGDDFGQTPKLGYIASTNSLLLDFKAGKIPVEDLNNFNESFHTYFFLRKYEILVDTSLSLSIEKMALGSDTIALPDYHGDNVDFHNTKVNGFPHNKAVTKYDTLNSEDQFKVNLTAKSDLVVFTSEFRYHNSTYLLKYYLKECNFKVYLHDIRGNRKPSHFRFSLEYLTDELQHTYNSSLKNYAQVNEMIKKQFLNATLTKYLPSMLKKLIPELMKTLSGGELKYVRSYLESMLSTLVKSAHQYIAAKGLNNFEVKPIYNKIVIDKNRKYLQTCEGVKVEGILNYIKFQLINSIDEPVSYFPLKTKLTDTILFTYPENGKKQAFVTFVVRNDGHKNSEKFKIKSIQLTAVYQEKYQMRSVALTNDITFLISFELYNFDPKYELLVKNTTDVIASTVNRVLFDKY